MLISVGVWEVDFQVCLISRNCMLRMEKIGFGLAKPKC